MFLIRFTFQSRLSLYISHDFHVWLASLTVSIEWILKYFTNSITESSELGQLKEQNQKSHVMNR